MPRTRTCLAAALMTLLLLSMSAHSMAGNGARGCDVRASLGFCYDYIGSDWTSQKASTDCGTAPDGKFIESGCPTEPVVGTCDYNLQDKEGLKIKYYFYKDAFSLKAAQMSCPGTFSAK